MAGRHPSGMIPAPRFPAHGCAGSINARIADIYRSRSRVTALLCSIPIQSSILARMPWSGDVHDSKNRLIDGSARPHGAASVSSQAADYWKARHFRARRAAGRTSQTNFIINFIILPDPHPATARKYNGKHSLQNLRLAHRFPAPTELPKDQTCGLLSSAPGFPETAQLGL